MGNIIPIPNINVIIESCLNCIWGRWVYVCDIEQNVEGLKISGGELKGIRADTIRRIRIAEWQGMKCLNQVEQWLSRSEKNISEIDKILENSQDEIEKLCIGGCCSTNLFSSYNFGISMDKISKEVDELLKQAKELNEVAGVALTEPKVLVPVGETVGLQTNLGSIISYLLDNDVAIVGIFGEKEVGKTTLLKEVNNFICGDNETSYFDLLILVDVSKQSMNETIQNHIGKKIGFVGEEWRSKSFDDKAIDILNVLRSKKFVLLLDNIFATLELTEIGIPSRKINMFYKVVFTTHSHNICSQMCAQKVVKLEPLGFEDSWRLFSDRIGEDVLNANPQIYPLAKKLVEECCGLPKILIKLAQDMAYKSTIQEWTDASKSLSLPMIDLQEEIIENMISIEQEEEVEECTTSLSTKLADTNVVFGSPITVKTMREMPEYVSRTRITARDLAFAAFDRETEGGKDVEAREYVNWLKTKNGNGVVTTCLFYNATGSTIHFSGHKDWNGHLSEELHSKKVENGQWGVFVHVHDNFIAGRGGSRGAIVYTGKNAYDNGCDWMLAWDNTSNDNQVHAKVFTEVRWKGHFFIQMPYIFHLLSGSGAHREDTHGGCVSSITLENTSGPFFIAKLSLDLAY